MRPLERGRTLLRVGWLFIGVGVVVLAVTIYNISARRPLGGQRFQRFVAVQAGAAGLAFVSAGVASLATGAVRTVAWLFAAAFLLVNIASAVASIQGSRGGRPAP